MRSTFASRQGTPFQSKGPVPQGTTVLINIDIYVYSLFIVNQGGGATVNVSVFDRSDAPVALIPSSSLTAGMMISATDGFGEPMDNGITITADAPGLHYRLKGYTP